MKHFLLFTFLILSNGVFSQQIACSPKDRQAVEDKLIVVDGFLENDLGKTMVAVGKTFLGTPYIAKTLEIGTKESLVVNLQGLDCTTFVENVLAFSLLLKNEKSSFRDFAEALETIRYKEKLPNP